MLSKKYRLKKYSAFIATYKLNNTISDKNVCIYFGREKTDNNIPAKFAFVVSKKIHKRAVVRNRIKRIFRESMRKIISDPGFSFVHNYMSVICVAKHSAAAAENQELSCSLTSLIGEMRCK